MLIRSGILVFCGNILDSLIVLLRNILFARFLSVEEYGIAATLSIILTLMDPSQTTGLNRMVVQSREGDDVELLNGVHGIQLAFGICTTLVMLVLAWPYASAMGGQEALGSYLVLALIPILYGLGNQDLFRQQRQGKFLSTTVRQIIPQVVSLVLVWPAYLLTRDHRAVLIVIFAQVFVSVIISYIAAEHPFRPRFIEGISQRAYRFGLPLIINTIVMFVVVNGDRMIVSNQFGLSVLGWFSVAVMLTMMPTMLIARSLQTLFLPVLSAVQHDRALLQTRNDILVSMAMILFVGFVGGMALLGIFFIKLMFGAKFLPAVPFLTLLAMMHGIRLVRALPALAAMATAETKNPLYANLIRMVAIPVALGVAIVTRDIFWMLAAGIVGECVAALAAAWFGQRMVGINMRHFGISFGAAILFGAAIISVANFDYDLWVLLLPAVLFLLTVKNIRNISSIASV